jgi:archaellum component FlaG (FlaF/FlaG flagellin family)
MSDEPTCQLHSDGQDLYVIVDGVKIAKRAAPFTALAMTWIVLEPGWVIRDIREGNAIEVRYEGASIH